jgi:ferredoxin
MPGVAVTITDRCTGCGTCTREICFANALHLADGRAEVGPDCRGCGRCVGACPNQAIELTVKSTAATEVLIREIEARVNVS